MRRGPNFWHPSDLQNSLGMSMRRLDEFGCVRFLGTLILYLFLSAGAQAQNDTLPNLAPEGWVRDTHLNVLKMDQYKTEDGNAEVSLVAFPPTKQDATAWTKHFIETMLKKDKTAGHKIIVVSLGEALDQPEALDQTKGSSQKSDSDVDSASFLVTVMRHKADNLLLVVRSFVRPGEPVQVSLRRAKGKISDAQSKQLIKIQTDARLPFHRRSAALGLDEMIGVMTKPLVYASEKSKSLRKSMAQKTPAVPNGKAPLLETIPGPRVAVSGKMIKNLPAGYRMSIKAKNYWTNSSMTATRTLHFTMTADGQFEKGHFAIAGGAPGSTGSVGVASSADKKGTTSTVAGSTNPGSSSGARSVFLKTRKGLDPTMYGPYYISGNKIEMRYANGKIEKHDFKTDGYRVFFLGDKKYFGNSPEGWTRKDTKALSLYRDLNGHYLARVQTVDNIDDGVKYLKRYTALLKSKNLIASASAIRTPKAGKLYKVATSRMEFRKKEGGTYQVDVYVRYGFGRGRNRVIRFEPHTTEEHKDMLIEFVQKVD